MSVKALKYRVEYSQFFIPVAELMAVAHTAAFSVEVYGDSATVTIHSQMASIGETRGLVEPFLRAWEIDAGLVRGYPMLSFRYVGAEESVGARVRGTLSVSTDAVFAFELTTLPKPPIARQPSLWSDVTWGHFRRYREGAQTLVPTAYACLTILEASAPHGSGHRRQRAAAYYGLEESDLRRLGEITNVGDPLHGRKYTGTAGELSPDDLAWIEGMLIKIVEAVCHPS